MIDLLPTTHQNQPKHSDLAKRSRSKIIIKIQHPLTQDQLKPKPEPEKSGNGLKNFQSQKQTLILRCIHKSRISKTETNINQKHKNNLFL